MNRIAAAVASFVLPCATSLAQSPPARPGGETASAFTAAEANAFACCLQIAAAWRAGDLADVRQWAPLPGYVGLVAARGDDGALHFGADGRRGWLAAEQGDPRQLFLEGGDALCYVVPAASGGAARRVFCVCGDGTIAFTDNTAGTTMTRGRAPATTDVLGAGDTLAAFPRKAGRGRDGNTWMPGDAIQQTTVRVMLEAENGNALGMTTIAAVPADSPQETIDAAIPPGIGQTQRDGSTTWSGVPVKGLALELRAAGWKLRIAPAAVTVAGSSVTVVLPRPELVKLGRKLKESAAIATLKNVCSAQAQCQAAGVIDANGNGMGEYGTFAELAGRDVPRGGKEKIVPPLLSVAFGKVEDGVLVRGGYCFRMFLPGKGGAPIAELANGGADAAIDADDAEVKWCAYAWPVEPGATGQRVFFVDQSGDVLAAGNDDGRYAGKAKPPAPNAARAAGSAGKLNDACAIDTAGLDGQVWRVVD